MKRDGRSVAAAGVAVGLWLALTVTAADPPKGLVLHFNFDQPNAGEGVADQSGKSNNGRLSGAKWTAAGKQGGGCQLAPAESAIRVAGGPSLALKQATFAVWFKTSRADAVWRAILDRRAGVDRGYALGIGDGGAATGPGSQGKLVFSVGGDTHCLSDVAVADGAWHHGAVTWDGETLRMYVDGLPQKQSASSRPDSLAVAADLTLGLNGSSASTWPKVKAKAESLDGAIDELMIFNRALTAPEVKAVVAAVDPSAGKPRFSKQQVAGRLRQLKLLFDEGLITEDFYARKVAECEAAR
jgi:Concanavalin A-like lectin/glucanases superfamily